MQISVCIIVKNEELNIERCLKCLASYDFEIVVVDTGSTDATKEIASKYTDHVYDFVWCDDFAAAKNHAISMATNEFVMVIDSDEYLEKIDTNRLISLLQKYPNKVGRIQRCNVFTRNENQQEYTEWINRVFSKKLFHYEGKIHEQVTAIEGSAYDTYLVPVLISHSGYDLPEDKRKEKAKRNITLLEKELGVFEEEDVPQSVKEERMPYVLYQLGKSYYMAGEYITACDYFSRGLSFDLNPKLEYVIDMVETYGYALINSGCVEEALFFENIYEEFGDSADFKFLMGLIYMNNSCFDKAIKEFEKATTYNTCKSKGVNSYSAYYNIGVIYECLGNIERARDYYKKCKSYEAAKKRLLVIEKS